MLQTPEAMEEAIKRGHESYDSVIDDMRSMANRYDATIPGAWERVILATSPVHEKLDYAQDWNVEAMIADDADDPEAAICHRATRDMCWDDAAASMREALTVYTDIYRQVFH